MKKWDEGIHEKGKNEKRKEECSRAGLNLVLQWPKAVVTTHMLMV
jgi:hypothetical protein